MLSPSEETLVVNEILSRVQIEESIYADVKEIIKGKLKDRNPLVIKNIEHNKVKERLVIAIRNLVATTYPALIKETANYYKKKYST